LQSYFSDEFGSFYRRLPSSVQKQADRAFEHFEHDSRYPSLKFKCVNQQQSRYSIRINRRCRALSHITGDEVTWYWIGIDHDEYERRIND